MVTIKEHQLPRERGGKKENGSFPIEQLYEIFHHDNFEQHGAYEFYNDVKIADRYAGNESDVTHVRAGQPSAEIVRNNRHGEENRG